MKALKFHPPVVNPIYRDLSIVLIASLLVSVAFVTMGYLVIASVTTP